MAKEIEGYLKLQIRGGQANPSPPVGPALGSKGLNIMDFCKAFNARSQEKQGQLLPVLITIFKDKSFDFVIKTIRGQFVDRAGQRADGRMARLIFNKILNLKLDQGNRRSGAGRRMV